jgi:hypothetical protein
VAAPPVKRTPRSRANDGPYTIRCRFSTSGDVAVDFCRFCRNRCAFAGKTNAEIVGPRETTDDGSTRVRSTLK